MSSYGTIVVKGNGHFIEGTLKTGSTPKPGTLMIMTSDAKDGSGNFTYKPWDGALDGERDEVIILRENEGLGKTVTDAYADSEHCYLYIPMPGDEVQVLFGNAAGTADDVAIGDKLIIDDGTGKVIPTTGSPEMEPFKALEAYVDPTADQLLHCRFTGH